MTMIEVYLFVDSSYLGRLHTMHFLYAFNNFCTMFGKTCVPCWTTTQEQA